jgi:RNA polymerase sigma-70 factor (ECF subfamily)
VVIGIEELFRGHWHLLLGYLTRRTGDASLAEELAQETFFRATRAFLGRKGGSPTAWLLAIARNVLIDEARRGRRLVQLEESLLAAQRSLEPDAATRDLLRRLPRSQQALLELVYVAGFSHAEVAAMTGSTAGAIKTAVYRARQALHDLHEEE